MNLSIGLFGILALILGAGVLVYAWIAPKISKTINEKRKKEWKKAEERKNTQRTNQPIVGKIKALPKDEEEILQHLGYLGRTNTLGSCSANFFDSCDPRWPDKEAWLRDLKERNEK